MLDPSKLTIDETQKVLNRVWAESIAWRQIEKRNDDAHTYTQQMDPLPLGKNIWHAILDDAIRMRKELGQ